MTAHAVLCFLLRDGEVLLIRKKKGFGAGKLVGVGGRIEPGETPEEA
ncbi:MAG: NUDIX domain-containing protein, partial [Thermofilaceae archaeon]